MFRACRYFSLMFQSLSYQSSQFRYSTGSIGSEENHTTIRDATPRGALALSGYVCYKGVQAVCSVLLRRSIAHAGWWCVATVHPWRVESFIRVALVCRLDIGRFNIFHYGSTVNPLSIREATPSRAEDIPEEEEIPGTIMCCDATAVEFTSIEC